MNVPAVGLTRGKRIQMRRNIPGPNYRTATTSEANGALVLGNHIEIGLLGVEAQILGPVLPGSKYGPALYWLCDLEQVSPSLWISVSALVGRGLGQYLLRRLLRGLSWLIRLNCLNSP